MKRAREWALRITHEAQLHEENCFLTLTYNDEQLPEHGSLYKPHLQKFFKRLRKRYPAKSIRYYACGEYGERTQRAHYHVCLFGHDFADKIEWRKVGEHTLYLSQTLNEIWGHGNTSIGTLTFDTAKYTASYVFKKQFGDKGGGYVRLDNETGEIVPLVQPFAAMSLRPAIAAAWMTRYHSDVYGAEKDFVFLKGKKTRPPKYYDKIYDTINPERMAYLKHRRATENEGMTETELRAHEEITRARTKQKTEI